MGCDWWCVVFNVLRIMCLKNSIFYYNNITMTLTRRDWCDTALKLCIPVLKPLSQRKFKAVFIDKRPTAALEAFTRVMLGMSYWIENEHDSEAVTVGELARQALGNATDPTSADYMNFACHEQALVEAAILAQTLVRAPKQLWSILSHEVKTNVINGLKATRVFEPHDNNWVLFPSMIEAFFLNIGESVDQQRLMYGINQYKKWYCGDGVYMDGEEFHFDYYNSFIIQPMLTDMLDVVSKFDVEMMTFAQTHNKRLERWGVIQERMIAPDGTYPPLGRSITYRCGAFHALAVCAYRSNITNLKPAQIRVALGRVIKATLQHPNTFEYGFLTIGLYGKQPGLGEPYINHGSLYMCCSVFAPLGLPHDSSFWKDADTLTTWESLQKGNNEKRDRPYTECIRKRGQCV
jgi:hypothetical protein